MRIPKSAAILSIMAVNITLFATSSSALPFSPGAGGLDLAARLKAEPRTIEVRNRGGDVAAGIIGGMILGGIIGSQRPTYYEDYPPYPIYRPYPVYRAYPVGDEAVAYCMRRFRSYDPYSMTYLGYDGFRHPCP